MARITVEDCLAREPNRFSLVHLAFRRAKQLLRGSKSISSEGKNNKSVVQSLREIAEGKVRFMTEEEMREAQENANHESFLDQIEAVPAPREPLDIFKDDMVFDDNGDRNGKKSDDEEEF